MFVAEGCFNDSRSKSTAHLLSLFNSSWKRKYMFSYNVNLFFMMFACDLQAGRLQHILTSAFILKNVALRFAVNGLNQSRSCEPVAFIRPKPLDLQEDPCLSDKSSDENPDLLFC